MTDDLLQRKIGVLFKANASMSRMARDLGEDGYSPGEIEAAIEEFDRARKRALQTKRSRARLLYALAFLAGLVATVYLVTFSDTHYIISTGFVGLMALGAVGFFLTVKPRRPPGRR